ncbi:MAG: RNA recognition motif domain-containing protein [Treponemataceae bacterium]
MTSIHIGNLNFTTTEEGLKAAFQEFGTVESARIIKDKETGSSKGFGFVDIIEDDKAINAIKVLNGKILDGRKIRVSKALPPEEREKCNDKTETRNSRSSFRSN